MSEWEKQFLDFIRFTFPAFCPLSTIPLPHHCKNRLHVLKVKMHLSMALNAVVFTFLLLQPAWPQRELVPRTKRLRIVWNSSRMCLLNLVILAKQQVSNQRFHDHDPLFPRMIDSHFARNTMHVTHYLTALTVAIDIPNEELGLYQKALCYQLTHGQESWEPGVQVAVLCK